MNERADQTNAGKLLIGASVSGLLLEAWLWLVVALGAQATATVPTSSSPTAENLPMDGGVTCREPATPAAADGSVGCAREFRHLVGTTREPGAGLTERPPGGES